MLLKLRILSVGLSLLAGNVLLAQNVATIADGSWNNPSIWSNGTIPTSSNSQTIAIKHNVSVGSGSSYTVKGVTVESGKTLTVDNGGTLLMDAANGVGTSITVNGSFIVNGSLIGLHQSKITSSAANTTINGTYEHRYTTTQGSVPLATWGTGSTLYITGYTNANLGITASSNLNQSFYNVTYNCTNQSGSLTLNGHLTSIANNFNVTSTGTGYLALVNDGNSNQNGKIINIGNALNLSGSSEFVLTRGATGTIINVGADLNVALAPDITCRFTATIGAGSYTINVGGSFIFNSPDARLTLVADNNSIGIIKVAGDISLIAGTLNEAGGGQVARGEMHFVGSGIQTFINTGGTTNNTQIDYYVYGTSILDLPGENALKGNNKSSLTVYSPGKVRVHSTNSSGAIITTGNGSGNLQLGGPLTFEQGSTLVYKGTTPQVVGSGHPKSAGMIFEVDNPAGVSFSDNSNNGNNGNMLEINGTLLLTSGNFNLQGSTKDRILVLNGSVQANSNKITANGARADIVINGSGAFGTFPFPAGTISFRNLTINRAGSGSVTFNNILNLNGTIDASQGTSTFNQAVSTSGDITVSNSASMLSLSTLTTGSSITIASTTSALYPYSTVTIGKDFTSNGTFSIGTNTVIFNGIAKQIVGGTSPNTFHHINITNAVDTVQMITNQSQGGVLSLSNNATFDPDGTSATPAVYTLLSKGDSPLEDGSIAALPASAQIIGDILVQRYMSPENRIYRYLSAPTSNAKVSDLQNSQIPITGTFTGASTGCTGCTSNPSMFSYDGATATYSAYPPSSGSNQYPMLPGHGYAVFVRQNLVGNVPIVIKFSGPVNRDNISLPMTFNSADPTESWNLVGNPYPSPVQWREVGWNRNNMDEWIAVRDNGTGMHHYCTYSGVGYDDLTNGIIATGQAFWVRNFSNASSLEITEQAKSTEEGAFYREQKSAYDVLSIAMKRGALKDFTYLQLKEGASIALDKFDATKMYNDNYNFSTVTGGQSLAVNVMNSISCGSELPLDISFVKTGSGSYVINPYTNYSFIFKAEGKLKAYTIHLKDKFLGTSKLVEDGSQIDFTITNNAGSIARDRFSLVFSEKLPVAEITEQTLSVCGDESVEVTVKNAEDGFTYSILKGDIKVGEVSGSGEAKFTLDAQSLTEGKNDFMIKATNGCGVEYNISPLDITKRELPEVSALDGQACGAGVCTLQANSAGAQLFNWYESATSVTPLAVNSGTLVTEFLQKSKTYYVTAVNDLGCEGERISVSAAVITIEPVITEQDQVFISNYESGNQWYLNGQMIEGATEPYFVPEITGSYTVSVSVKGCSAFSGGRSFTINGEEKEWTNEIETFPNPTAEKVFIRVTADAGFKNAGLISSNGNTLLTTELNAESGFTTGIISLQDYPAGFYLIKLTGDRKMLIRKVVKK